MAITKMDIEWFYDPSTYFKEYGLTMLGGGKYAVVKAKGFMVSDEEYEVMTVVDDRKTAIGFLKLLKEK
jgi:hypothetical protein